jgi:putative chitinase
MNLTEHFTLEELTVSPTAKRLKLPNTPTAEHIANMKYVCQQILEPVRVHFGKPVQINSSYRSPAVNKAVGGSPTSQHSNGEAVDFEIPGISNKVVADWVADNLIFDQVILEFYNAKDGANSGWVHASIKRNGKNRGQRLVAAKSKAGGTVYTPVADFDPSTAPVKVKHLIAGTPAPAPAAAAPAAPAAAPAPARAAAPKVAGPLPTNPMMALQTKAGIAADGAFGPGTFKAGAKYLGLTGSRAVHFFAQTAHETGGFKAFSENLNYSAKGLRGIFGKYFPTDALANQYARKPEKIANKVYASRMGNGDEASGDGWKYRGRGALQLTGKDNYQAFANYCKRPDVMTNPDLVAGELAFESAMFFFERNNLWAICDKGLGVPAITALTKRINGGTHGLDDRIAKTNKFSAWI